jgi:nucleoid-associated protein YgaU
MLDMTSNALGGIMAATGTAGAPAAPRTALQELVVKALQDGKTDATIDTLVNEAALAGDVSVPEILVTSTGRVDTAVLLASIVAQAKIANGGPAPAVPDTPTGSQDGVEVRVVQRATANEQYRFYTVSSGDSLGSIAIKFYGDAGRYPVIFEANKTILASPDRIQTGQRLVIPELG